jgi:hypothetical protein
VDAEILSFRAMSCMVVFSFFIKKLNFSHLKS